MEKMPFRDAQEVIDVHAVMSAAAHAGLRRATGGRRSRC